jgi:CheY-like chemotaxis protein
MQTELNNEIYEAADLINGIFRFSRASREEKEVEFAIRIDENIPMHLYGDMFRIRQALAHFLSNAFKHTEQGTVIFSMYALFGGGETDGAISLLTTIRDTGHGLFERSDMPAAFNILKQLDAEFEVESKPGIGTIITLLIPQKAAGEMPLGKEAVRKLRLLDGNTRVVTTPMPYGRVLIVDDMPPNILVAKELLNPYRLQVDTCESGHDCIERIKSGKQYDIIFMDCHMPGLGGAETVRLLREIGYIRPIVALTANALVGQAQELMKRDFDGFLSKPVSTAHLNEVLNKFIRDVEAPKDSATEGL